MKIQAIGLILVIGSIANAGVPNFRPVPVTPVFELTAELTDFDFQKGGELIGRSIASADLDINRRTGEITVTLSGPNHCPKGVMCAAANIVGPMSYSYTAKLDAVTMGRCGGRTFHALTDNRRADGGRTEITVVDHSGPVPRNSLCAHRPGGIEILPFRNATEVTLKLDSARGNVTETDYLGGGVLKAPGEEAIRQ